MDSFSFNEVGELFNSKNKLKKELLQALLYCFFLKEKAGYAESFQPVIYSLKRFFDNKFVPEIKYQKQEVCYQEIESEFTGHLKVFLEGLFSTEAIFDQTTDYDFCKYCPYRKICQRF